jgi:hypothetical protein
MRPPFGGRDASSHAPRPLPHQAPVELMFLNANLSSYHRACQGRV